MALNFNTIGNYSTSAIKGNQKSFSGNTLNEAGSSDNINSNEKEYFANLYPSNKNEIMEYSFYGRKGKMSGVSIGINLDRRG
jgi:hypothetical protein